MLNGRKIYKSTLINSKYFCKIIFTDILFVQTIKKALNDENQTLAILQTTVFGDMKFYKIITLDKIFYNLHNATFRGYFK